MAAEGQTDTPHRLQIGALHALSLLPRRFWLLAALLWATVQAAISVWYVSTEIGLLNNRFQNDAEEIYLQVSQRFSQNEAVLNSLASLLNTFPSLRHDHIRRFSREMLAHYPHIYMIELEQRVDHAERARFERDMSASQQRQIRIRDFGMTTQRQWRSAPQRDFYFPIMLMEPMRPEAAEVIGLDVYHDPVYQPAVEAALSTGRMSASGSIELVEGGRAYVFFKALPSSGMQSYTRHPTDSMMLIIINTDRLMAPLMLDRRNLSLSIWHDQLARNQTGARLFGTATGAPSCTGCGLLPALNYTRRLATHYQPFELEISRQIRPGDLNPLPLLTGTLIHSVVIMLLLTIFAQRRETLRQARETQDELFRSRERASVTLQAINDGMITFDTAKRVEYLNPMACELIGATAEQCLQRPVDTILDLRYELAHEIVINPFDLCLQSAHCIDLSENSVLVRHNGNELLIEGSVSPLFEQDEKVGGGVLIFRNMGPVRRKARAALEASEQRLREHAQQLAHVSRLHTMGEMASGIAHEINQPLTAILSYNQACVRLLQEEDPDLEMVTGALRSAALQAQRAGEIIKRLRAFISQQPMQTTAVSLNQVVSNVLSLDEHELRSNAVSVDTQLDHDLPPVMADPIQLEQVALNLVRNALDATRPISPWGRIRISTRHTATHVVLEVSDNGSGLSQEAIDQLFIPFFTTKKTGMGLGLTICHSIIESFGGTIRASNRSSGGVTFTVELPVSHKRPAPGPHYESNPHPA